MADRSAWLFGVRLGGISEISMERMFWRTLPKRVISRAIDRETDRYPVYGLWFTGHRLVESGRQINRRKH